LDQAIALCGNEITIAKLETALGLLDRASFFELVKCVGDHDPGRALKISAQMMAKGIDAKLLLNRLVDFFCDLHYRAFTGESRVPDAEMDSHFAELCEKLAKDEIVRAMDLGLKTQASLYQAVSTPMAVESFIVKLCLQRPALPSAGQLAQPVSGHVSAPARSATPTRVAQPAQQSMVAPTAASLPAAPLAEAPDLAPLESYIRQHRPAWTPVLQSVLRMKNSAGVLEVQVKADFAGRRLASNDGVELLKAAYNVQRATVHTEASSAASASAPLDPREKFQQKQTMAKEHDAVKAAIKVFDAVITETKILEDGKGVSP
jgi:DNA polymerase III gamma/tau subunit